MDDTLDCTLKSKPKLRNKYSSLFFGTCLGCSTKNTEKMKQKINSDDRKKARWRFSWSGLRRKRFELSEKVNRCKQMVHDEDKIARKSQVAVTGDQIIESQILQDKPLKKRRKPIKGKNSDYSQSFERMNTPRIESSQHRLCYDKKIKEENGENITSRKSLGEGSGMISQNPPMLSKASTFPLQKLKKKKVTIEETGKEKPQEGENKHAKNSESIYGLSILIVTLVIMLFWGKLCAILCASTLLYLIPRLKSEKDRVGVSINSSESELKQIKFNMNIDEARKKKVVMEGFLERNNNRKINFV